MKALYLILTLITGALLVYGALDMPAFGDPDSPANTYVSPRYIEDSLRETEVPNIVTSVLADYRGFDTMGETSVVFAGGVAVLLILRKPRRKEKKA